MRYYLLAFCLLVALAIIFYSELTIFLFIPFNWILSPQNDFDILLDHHEYFPYSQTLEENYIKIRDEGWKLFEKHRGINHLNYFPLGDINKEGWTTIPLKLFGRSFNLASEAPFTQSLIEEHPEIKSCIFSIMEPQKIIEEHADPYTGIVRYQLPLDIPQEGECFLTVNNKKHFWKNGEGFIFNQHQLHKAINKSDKCRLVLLVDLAKKFDSKLKSDYNEFFISLLGYLPQTFLAALM